MDTLRAHPVWVLVACLVTLGILQNDNARFIASLLVFVVSVIALAQIFGFQLRL